MSHGNAALSVVGDGVVGGEEISLALRGLVLLAQFHGIAADADQLAHECASDNARVDDTMLVLVARRLGLKAKIAKLSVDRLAMANLPALVFGADDDAFILARINGEQVLIHDLRTKRPQTISFEQLTQRYAGRILQVASRASVLGDLARFDFSWFIPAVVKYRKLLTYARPRSRSGR